MATVSTSETSVNLYKTILRNIPDERHLHGKFVFNYRISINRKAILQLIPITQVSKQYKIRWDILNTLEWE